MKKIVSLLLACTVLFGCVFALASCGKTLSGKYEYASQSEIGDVLGDLTGSGATYTFDGKKVTVTAKFFGFEKSFEGEYEISENDEGKTVITITFTGEDAEDKDATGYAGEFSFSEGEEDGVKYIKIGGAKYTKVEKK